MMPARERGQTPTPCLRALGQAASAAVAHLVRKKMTTKDRADMPMSFSRSLQPGWQGGRGPLVRLGGGTPPPPVAAGLLPCRPLLRQWWSLPRQHAALYWARGWMQSGWDTGVGGSAGGCSTVGHGGARPCCMGVDPGPTRAIGGRPHLRVRPLISSGPVLTTNTYSQEAIRAASTNRLPGWVMKAIATEDSARIR